MPIKAVLFDLDDTLIHEGFTTPVMCDDTIEVLEYLKKKQIKIILATHNYSAANILKDLNIEHYFEAVLAYYDYTDKVSHLWRVLQKLDLKPNEVVLFDDLIENVSAVRRHGANAVLVDHVTGIKLAEVVEKIESTSDVSSTSSG